MIGCDASAIINVSYLSYNIDHDLSDPPYFKVISEKWDYQWRTENDYIEWSKKWLSEAYRSLRKGGSENGHN